MLAMLKETMQTIGEDVKKTTANINNVGYYIESKLSEVEALTKSVNELKESISTINNRLDYMESAIASTMSVDYLYDGKEATSTYEKYAGITFEELTKKKVAEQNS